MVIGIHPDTTTNVACPGSGLRPVCTVWMSVHWWYLSGTTLLCVLQLPANTGPLLPEELSGRRPHVQGARRPVCGLLLCAGISEAGTGVAKVRVFTYEGRQYSLNTGGLYSQDFNCDAWSVCAGRLAGTQRYNDGAIPGAGRGHAATGVTGDEWRRDKLAVPG